MQGEILVYGRVTSKKIFTLVQVDVHASPTRSRNKVIFGAPETKLYFFLACFVGSLLRYIQKVY